MNAASDSYGNIIWHGIIEVLADILPLRIYVCVGGGGGGVGGWVGVFDPQPSEVFFFHK